MHTNVELVIIKYKGTEENTEINQSKLYLYSTDQHYSLRPSLNNHRDGILKCKTEKNMTKWEIMFKFKVTPCYHLVIREMSPV